MQVLGVPYWSGDVGFDALLCGCIFLLDDVRLVLCNL